MPLRLDSAAGDFASNSTLFSAPSAKCPPMSTRPHAASSMTSIKRGDAALIELSQRFDRIDLDRAACASAARRSPTPRNPATAKALDALALAREPDRGLSHSPDSRKDERFTDALGVELGSRWTAIEAVGLYVPGGTAAYPSSVLMNAVPAKVAGVPRIVMVVPAPDGKLNPLVLAAAQLAGVDEIYRVGGAQAVAALAYGTETHQAGRQDRRARQRLCRRRQAHRVRQGRNRHDRGPLRSPDRRRQDRQSGLDRRRSAGAGGARRGRAIDPDHRRRGSSPTRWRRRSRRN